MVCLGTLIYITHFFGTQPTSRDTCLFEMSSIDAETFRYFSEWMCLLLHWVKVTQGSVHLCNLAAAGADITLNRHIQHGILLTTIKFVFR